jgi:pyrimidine-nucleoside phosphorylase
MRMYDLIYTKKTGGALSPEQIAFWVDGAAKGTIPDEQSAALLMAICWRGMNTEETLALTLGMRDSGDKVDLSSVPGIKVDKHSTGGVGDKTTLILGPLVAACGLPCSMFSGRGLGHTGGTVDKYMAIPGLRVELDVPAFIDSLRQTGFANSAQTGDICPADRKLYALRDVTATVESIPLITASIMSKKLAGGSNALVLDVKCGGGAFMKTLEDATALARSMVDVGKAHGMRIKALITRMEEPLGWAIGNSLEIMESVEILKGAHGDSDLAQESFRLAAEMLVLGGAATDLEGAFGRLREAITSGRVMETYRTWAAHNGGDPACLDDFSRLPQPGAAVEVRATTTGWIHAMDSRALGILAMEQGAGRRSKDDVLDLGVGIRLHANVGDRIQAGDRLFTVYTKAGAPVPTDRFLAAVDVRPEARGRSPWLLDVLE